MNPRRIVFAIVSYLLLSGPAMALGIPAPATLAAEAITANQARLRATALSDTTQNPTVFTYFKIGTTSPPTDSEVLGTPDTVVYPLSNDVPYSATATNLTCGTRYYYQAGLRTAAPFPFIKEGNVVDFTTQSCTPPQPIPTLSEWAQIMMMLAMIATAVIARWRMKCHAAK